MSVLPFQIKSEKLTSFGGIFPIMEKFDTKMTYKKFTGYSLGILNMYTSNDAYMMAFKFDFR